MTIMINNNLAELQQQANYLASIPTSPHQSNGHVTRYGTLTEKAQNSEGNSKHVHLMLAGTEEEQNRRLAVTKVYQTKIERKLFECHQVQTIPGLSRWMKKAKWTPSQDFQKVAMTGARRQQRSGNSGRMNGKWSTCGRQTMSTLMILMTRHQESPAAQGESLDKGHTN